MATVMRVLRAGAAQIGARALLTTATRQLHRMTPLRGVPERISVVFRDLEGGEEVVSARVGQNILDVAIDHDMDLEGACGGTLACSTCHVILQQKDFDSFPEPEEEELDMLDLAIGLTDTSRLGCQCILTKENDGIVVTLPDEHSDVRGAY